MKVETYGLLKQQIEKNYERLHSPIYDENHIFRDNSYAWSGDWEGRTILALVSLWKATGKKPARLDAILTRLYEKLQPNGYLGAVLDTSKINEMQLAGNGWLLSGLCELYELTQDEKVLQAVCGLVNKLYLVVAPFYRKYPLEIANDKKGKKMGEYKGKVENGWALSTDVGCAFISLDGITRAYQILKWGNLKQNLADMIDQFEQIDIVKNNYQTHASLSCARAVIRFYECTGEEKYLRLAKRVMEEYIRFGMTANYSNYNWFSVQSWTEPCAIIDSFILAKRLFLATGERKYLLLMQNIYYNALLYAQRDNGGFGCDSCVDETQPVLMMDIKDNYEALWCCTMRGGEGLFEASTSQLLASGTSFILGLFNSFRYTDGKNDIEVRSEYPYGSTIEIVVHRIEGGRNIRIPVFDGGCKTECNRAYTIADGYILLENLYCGEKIELSVQEQVVSGEYHGKKIIRKGLLLLGELNECNIEKKYLHVYPYHGKEYVAVMSNLFYNETDARKIRLKLIF